MNAIDFIFPSVNRFFQSTAWDSNQSHAATMSSTETAAVGFTSV